MTQIIRSGVGKLSDDKRKAIGLQAFARIEPIRVLAERHGVSRPTVYRQIDTASAALDEAFDTMRAADSDQVLFMLPVTRRWLDQVIVALTMVGHVSFRGTLELMHDLLGVSTSLGTLHSVLQRAAQQAMAINAGVDLSAIRVGLHDELFQGSHPVLAGIDVASTYCYRIRPRTPVIESAALMTDDSPIAMTGEHSCKSWRRRVAMRRWRVRRPGEGSVSATP